MKASGFNAIGGDMSGGGAVSPKADDGTNVYLITIDNRNSDMVYIDGNEYQPVNHTSAVSNDTNLYVYLTGTKHIIKVGENVVNYHFDSTTFSECKDDDKDHLCDVCNTTLSEHSGGEATCKVKAVFDYCDSECGELDSTNHNLKKISAKDATVTEKGNKGYWHCKDCDKYFADESGTNEIYLDDTVIPKLPPDIIDGKGQTVTKGEKKKLTFRSNASFSDFIRVELDGKTLDKKIIPSKKEIQL